MYIVQIMNGLYFHYFLKGEMVIGDKKFAKHLSMIEIEKLGLLEFKKEVVLLELNI